jgi:hypothetical protein
LAYAADYLENVFVVVEDLMIGESDDVIAVLLELRSAEGVVLRLFRLEMVIAIELDNESVFGTDEIEDEWAHGLLPPELQPIELTASEALPHCLLGRR